MSIAEPGAGLGGGSHLELPETDGKPKESSYQPVQSALLMDVLIPILGQRHPDGNYLTASDTGIYWRRTKVPLDGCHAPDWYYVPNVPRLLDGKFRRSYVLWDEVISPLIAIKYVFGDGTKERDRTPNTGIFWVYEQAIKASYYVIWDPFRTQLEVFELVRGRYHPLTPDDHGRYQIPELGVSFGSWNGIYQGLPADWLRVWENGRLVPTPQEQYELVRRTTERERRSDEDEKTRAEAETSRAEAEKARAEAERQRAEKLAARLRELGVDPDSM